ncbi:MAG: Uma2 family endonuclease [Acidobacteriota bacterium]
MEIRTPISVQEYLSTAYSPDCDFVDGEVQERNLGELDHGRLQKRLLMYFGLREKEWGIEVVPEQRVQVSPTRFRIPDVCVVLGEPDGQILRKPPFLCIEILSPEDRLSRMRERVEDYFKMGVPHVWVVDPATQAAYQITPAEGWREVKDGLLQTQNPHFEVPLAEIFA